MVFACSIDSISRTKFVRLSHFVALIKRCSLILFWPIPAMTQPIFMESRIVSRLIVVMASRKSPSNKRRSQNLCQLPDHTRFAGRLVLVDQCSLSLKSFSLFVCQNNFQRSPFAEENQCVIEVCCNTLQLSTCPFLESKIQFGHSSLISRSCLH